MSNAVSLLFGPGLVFGLFLGAFIYLTTKKLRAGWVVPASLLAYCAAVLVAMELGGGGYAREGTALAFALAGLVGGLLLGAALWGVLRFAPLLIGVLGMVGLAAAVLSVEVIPEILEVIPEMIGLFMVWQGAYAFTLGWILDYAAARSAAPAADKGRVVDMQ